MIPLLILCLEWLNPNTIAFATTTNDMELEFDENMFGMGRSRTFVIKELFLYRRLSISSFACANPFYLLA